jgi:hypothetical protein
MAKVTQKTSPAKPAPKMSEALQDTRPVTTEQPKADQPKAPKVKRDRSKLYASYTFQPADVITLGQNTKAKVKGSMAEAKFALYGDLSNGGSTTVGDVLAKCKGEKAATFTNEDGKVVKLKPSVRWDWAHDLIRINGERYEPKAA